MLSHTSTISKAHVRKSPEVPITHREPDTSEKKFEFSSPVLPLNRLWSNHLNTDLPALRLLRFLEKRKQSGVNDEFVKEASFPVKRFTLSDTFACYRN